MISDERFSNEMIFNTVTRSKPLYLTILWSNKEPRDTLNNGEEMHLDPQLSHMLHNESCQKVEEDSMHPSKYL